MRWWWRRWRASFGRGAYPHGLIRGCSNDLGIDLCIMWPHQERESLSAAERRYHAAALERGGRKHIGVIAQRAAATKGKASANRGRMNHPCRSLRDELAYLLDQTLGLSAEYFEKRETL